MTVTVEILRQNVLRLCAIGVGPKLGVYSSTSRAVGTITLPEIANDNLHVKDYESSSIFMPDLTTDADRQKPAGDLVVATGVLDNDGTDWTGTASTAEQVELMVYITPRELFDQMVASLKRMSQTVQILLGGFTDSDCETAGTTNWTASSSALSKVSSAGNKLFGSLALFINLSGANGYAESPSIRVNPGSEIYVSAILRAIGTGSLILYDVTNAATFGTAPTHTGVRFGHLWRHENVPAGCEEITVRIAGSGATDDIYLDAVGGPFVLDADLSIALPAWVDENHRLRKIRQASYTPSLASGLDDAHGRSLHDWAMRDDYAFNALHGDVRPYTLEMRRRPPAADLWLEGVRRAYDMTSTTLAWTAAAEAYTIDMPEDYVSLYVARDVCRYILKKEGPIETIQEALRQINDDLGPYLRSAAKELDPAGVRVYGTYGRA